MLANVSSKLPKITISKNIIFFILFSFIHLFHAEPEPIALPAPKPDPRPDPRPVALPEPIPFLGAGANRPLLESLQKRLPKEGEKTEILISYLAAIPKLYDDVEQYLRNISSSKSESNSRDEDRNHERERKLGKLASCLRYDTQVSTVSGALVAAIVEINNDTSILPNHQLKYTFGNTCGNDSQSTRLFMEHWQAGARVFIGPEKNCKTEAAMASSQNLPIISYRCNDQDISRENYHYRTFARTVPPSGEIFKAFLALMKHNKWRKFSVIYDSKNGHATNELFETLKATIEEENEYDKERKFEIMNVSKLAFEKMDISSDKDIEKIETAIRTTMDTTRIYLTFENVRLFRAILSKMGEMGLTEKDYMLIYVDPNYDWLNVYHAMNNHFLRSTMTYLHYSWMDNSTDLKMIDYARSALSIIPTPVHLDSVKFENFWKKAREYLHHFGVQGDNLKVNRIACYLYDAVYLYARAVHELIQENENNTDRRYDPTADGKAIVDKIVNRKYRSIQGFDMRIDSKGNSKGNFTLLSWQQVVPVVNANLSSYYPPNHALDRAAIFVEPVNKTQRLPDLSFIGNKKIHWKNGETPPLDEPECGFYGEKCEQKLTLVTLSILIFVTVFSAVLTGFTYRSRKFEKELSMIWRIDPSEVHQIIGGNESTVSLLAANSGGENLNFNRLWFNEAECKGSGMRGVASYKGALVALKEIVFYRKPRDLTRNAKKELRVMRQLAHPNVNNFMGIVICQTSICAVREFCSKGSLLDILRNPDLKLDHLYIASFVEDLVKGMIYIHDSELRVHGNLKSTNCLITSRWALQIADYGLYEIRDGMQWDERPAMWENFLWTAPECMTISGQLVTRLPPTQKSDVYSFGIILHEIFTREGPYELCVERGDINGYNFGDRIQKDEQFEKIVRRIYNDPSFRPNVKETDAQNFIKEVMQSCWHNDPLQRPEFKSGIRNKLKPLFNQIYKRNIMDHMIVMMEKYQTQLEDLVEERTTELRDEQKRSQHLLQRMLPRSVADQLLAGQDVVPEAFPPVTIYFSDIVGFTTISGESTPMEVVTFLNKLYTLFDGIIRRYDVYKVETIGDAYMVVSGVPQYKTMEFHAEQIAMMALHILTAVRTFIIPHRNEEQLMIRIGMHTGPCVAGVVGKTMPRYTLFGDTVNTASRMESNGEALRIHCSSSTRSVLGQIDGFVLEERGTMPIKGKGHMTTYWLNGRDGHDFAEFEKEVPDESKRVDIFARQTSKIRTGSNWGVNRGDSTLSLAATEKGLKRIGRNTDTVYFNSSNGGFACIGTAVSREMPSVCEDEKESYFGSNGKNLAANRKRSNTSRGFAASRNFASTISNTSSFRPQAVFEHDTLAMRKRSTSLPDGEKLNIDFLEAPVKNCSSIPIAKVTPNTRFENSSPSPTQSQYPSYRDLHTTPHERKRGIATVYPIRKRSLSCGDAIPKLSATSENNSSITSYKGIGLKFSEIRASSPEDLAAGASFQEDDEKSLISERIRERGGGDDYETATRNEDGLRSCPQHRRKNKRSRFLRDPSPLARRIRDASPFSGKTFWNSKSNVNNNPPRGESITRLFRKWRGDNEYEDLNDNDEDFETETEEEISIPENRANRSISCSPNEEEMSTDNSEPLLTTISEMSNSSPTVNSN